MDPAKVWPEIDKWSKWCVAWVMWGLGIVLPFVLLLLVLKGTKAGVAVGDYVPMPTSDYLVWLYIMGMYWLIKK